MATVSVEDLANEILRRSTRARKSCTCSMASRSKTPWEPGHTDELTLTTHTPIRGSFRIPVLLLVNYRVIRPPRKLCGHGIGSHSTVVRSPGIQAKLINRHLGKTHDHLSRGDTKWRAQTYAANGC